MHAFRLTYILMYIHPKIHTYELHTWMHTYRHNNPKGKLSGEEEAEWSLKGERS